MKTVQGAGMTDSITVDGLCKRSARLAGRFMCEGSDYSLMARITKAKP
jgi:hypothetical protein